MAVDFQTNPSKSSSIQKRWLHNFYELSRPEQAFLNTWISRNSRDLRDTIARECSVLYDIGFFDSLPDLRIIPQIDNIAEVGARKFMRWTEDLVDSLPKIVLSGFKSLGGDVTALIKKVNPFEDIEESSKFAYRFELEEKDGLMWEKPILYNAKIFISSPDERSPVNSSFPTLIEAAVFSFYHEAAHGALLLRQGSNPILADVNHIDRADVEPLTDVEISEDNNWLNESWAVLFSVKHGGDSSILQSLTELQDKWSEYYADVGGVLMHARQGYDTKYLDSLCAARENGDWGHKTDQVLRELSQILDFHPIVLHDKITAFDLHAATGTLIAPYIGKDLITLMSEKPEMKEILEDILPEFPNLGYEDSKQFQAMNSAFGDDCPKLAMFFAKLKDGPEPEQIAKQLKNTMVQTLSVESFYFS